MPHTVLRNACRMRGMTLIELLVVLTVTAVLANFATPMLASLVSRWQRDSATSDLVSHLQLARSVALKSTRRVVMCNSLDGSQCAPAANKDWAGGWLLYQDNNANGLMDSGELPFASTGAKPGIQSLASSNKIRQFIFTPNGLMASGMSSLVVTPPTGASIKIIVSRTGRVRLSETDQ